MKKKFLSFQGLVLLFCLSLFVACSSEKQAYESQVAVTDNSVVVAINPGQLLTKSGLSSDALKDNIFLMSVASDPNLAEMVKLLQEDVKNTGLDLKKNIYGVITSKNDVNNSVTISVFASLSDSKKFENFLNSNPEVAKYKKSDVNKFKHYEIERDLNLLYSSDLLVITADSKALESVTKPSKTLADFKYVQELQKTNDFSIAFTQSAINKIRQNPIFQLNGLSAMNMLSNENSSLFDGLYSVASINFEKGEIVFSQYIFAETEVAQDFIDKSNSVFKSSSHKLESAINLDPYFYMATAFNGTELYDYLLMVLKSYSPDLLTNISDEDLLKVSEIANKINGEVLFALSDFSLSFFNFSVDMSLLVESKADELYKLVRTIIIEDMPNSKSAIAKDSDTQLVLSESGFTVYIGYDKEIFYVTTNAEVAADPTRKPAENLTKSRYYNTLSKEGANMAIDLKKIVSNPMIQMALNSQVQKGNAELMEILQSLDYIVAMGDDREPNVTKLVLQDKEENSLVKLISLVNKIIAYSIVN